MINYPENAIDSKSFRSSKRVGCESFLADIELQFVFQEWVGLAMRVMEMKKDIIREGEWRMT